MAAAKRAFSQGRRRSGAPRRTRGDATGDAGEVSRAHLEIGQKLQDRRSGRVGTILEFACQYAHPKAEPVYSYLVRWDDGQVQALSEAALEGGHGLELVD